MKLSSELIILTGNVGSGKTTLIKNLIQKFREKKIHFSGLVSPARIEGGKKTGIFVQDLSSKKEKLLAEYQPGWDPEKPERKWKMDFEVLEWGNQIIKSSIPTSVLIIDELGYLELEKKEGWVEAFKILDHGLYDSAVLVIRSELIDLALKHWQNATVISMENPSKLDDLFNQIEDSIAKK